MPSEHEVPAVAALLVRPAWLRTRWPYLALALVIVGYGSLLAHHIRTDFAVVTDIDERGARIELL